jgi:DNA-binding response OmpR family regulator
VKEKTTQQAARILVLEPDGQLMSAILDVLKQAVPNALVEKAPNLEEAQKLVLGVKPDLFVLDVDATHDLGQDFLYDLRTSHPNARAIVLTGIHLPAQRERVTGLGAIHFLEKPFSPPDFYILVQASLRPSATAESEKFQGTLRDLHVADIIQLKCMSGATSVVEFTGPHGEKARVFFERGQIRHATSPGREGIEAFNQIVTWRGGTISEVVQAGPSPQTIKEDWQMLLMEAARNLDETTAISASSKTAVAGKGPGRKVLAIDDSPMLLSFVQEVLIETHYDVTTAATGEEGVRAAKKAMPDLILLDFLLPDIKGDEVCRRLLEDPATAAIPVVYMSGYTAHMQPDAANSPNVIGFLNKPFTSDLLVKTVETHMPKSPEGPEPEVPPAEPQADATEFPVEQEAAYRETQHAEVEVEQAESPAAPEPAWWSTPPAGDEPPAGLAEPFTPISEFEQETAAAPPAYAEEDFPDESVTAGAFFCGDTRFFSLHWALQTIAKQRLTGMLRSYWEREPVDVLARDGQIVLVTTRDVEMYCPDTPITLANVDPERLANAREEQRQTGCPLFITLSQENLILQEPAEQLVQHYGQRLFAQLWSAPHVRFVFHQGELPSYTDGIQGDGEVDQWVLSSLRQIQSQELGNRADYDPTSIPAYTRDGYERVQNLRLTVAEAQFASQFNGVRSIQQIAKNLRLDFKFARLTLFRFLALEIVECWPAATAAARESQGFFQRIAHSIGIGE